jgi:hypothetical protein
MNAAIRMVIGDNRIRTAPDRVQLELAARRFLVSAILAAKSTLLAPCPYGFKSAS